MVFKSEGRRRLMLFARLPTKTIICAATSSNNNAYKPRGTQTSAEVAKTASDRVPPASIRHSYGADVWPDQVTAKPRVNWSQRSRAPRSTAVRNFHMSSTNLLIVDDDIVFANRMSIALSKRGFQVRKANTKHEALAAIEAEPPECAVIDLRLGDGSGLDVLAALHSVRPEARAIILSGYGNLPCTVAAIRFGAFDCLSKPADADEVAQALLAAPGSLPQPPVKALSPSDARWLHIERVFNDCGHNVSEASRRLNMHRRTLQRILARRTVGPVTAPLEN